MFFRAFDKDNDGFLRTKDLWTIMEPHLTRKDLELFIKEADSAGNGQVKYEGRSS